METTNDKESLQGSTVVMGNLSEENEPDSGAKASGQRPSSQGSRRLSSGCAQGSLTVYTCPVTGNSSRRRVMNVLWRPMTLLFFLPEFSWVQGKELGMSWHWQQVYGRGKLREHGARGPTVLSDSATFSTRSHLGTPRFNIITCHTVRCKKSVHIYTEPEDSAVEGPLQLSGSNLSSSVEETEAGAGTGWLAVEADELVGMPWLVPDLLITRPTRALPALSHDLLHGANLHLPLIRTFTTGFRVYPNSPGRSHLKILTLITSRKMLFPSKVTCVASKG